VETKNWPAPLEIRDGKLLSAGRAYPGAGLGELAELAARFSDHLRERCGLRVDVVPLLCLANGRIAAAPVRESGVWLCGLGQVLPLVQSSEHAALPEALLQRLADTLAEPYATTKE
jgi:hypothetical protein